MAAPWLLVLNPFVCICSALGAASNNSTTHNWQLDAVASRRVVIGRHSAHPISTCRLDHIIVTKTLHIRLWSSHFHLPSTSKSPLSNKVSPLVHLPHFSSLYVLIATLKKVPKRVISCNRNLTQGSISLNCILVVLKQRLSSTEESISFTSSKGKVILI